MTKKLLDNRHLEYGNVKSYGFVDLECRRYRAVRKYGAGEFVMRTSIMASLPTLREPDRSAFFESIRNAVLNRIRLDDTVILYLARRPQLKPSYLAAPILPSAGGRFSVCAGQPGEQLSGIFGRPIPESPDFYASANIRWDAMRSHGRGSSFLLVRRRK